MSNRPLISGALIMLQLAALACMLAAHVIAGEASATLSVTGLLLFILTLALANVRRRRRAA